ERVAGQQQHRQAVDGGQRGAGDHVRRARADRRRARPRAEAIALPRVADRHVHHRLLVARRHVAHLLGVLGQRLAEGGDVAVPEDAQAAGEEARAHAVALDLLGGQEADQGLGHGQLLGHPAATSWGSTCGPYGPCTVWSKSITEPVTIAAASLSRYVTI